MNKFVVSIALSLLLGIGSVHAASCTFISTFPSLKGLRKVHVDANTGDPTEGEGYDYYYKGKKLLYVVTNSYGETSRRSVLFFVPKDSPDSFAAFVSEYSYAAPIYQSSKMTESVRKYVLNVCHGRTTKKSVEIDSEEVQELKFLFRKVVSYGKES